MLWFGWLGFILLFSIPPVVFSKPFRTVQRAPTTICIVIIFMFRGRGLTLCLSPSVCLCFHLFLKFSHNLQSEEQNPLDGKYIFLSSLINTRSGRLAGIRLSVCFLKSQRNLCVSFSRTDSGLFIYLLVVCSNLNFLHNSQWIIFPTQSCLVLNSKWVLCRSANREGFFYCDSESPQ